MGRPNSRFGLDEDQLELQRVARAAAREHGVDQAQWEADGHFPWSSVSALAETGLLGLTHPSEVGGGEADRLTGILALEQVARESFTLAEAVQIAINGPAYVLSTIADSAVRDTYVPDVISGKALISIAITEDEAGSSLGDTATTARSVQDGVVLDGTKGFVTAGSLASAHLVMARFGGEGLRGLGYVLVPADADGCEVVQTYEKMGGNAIPEAVIRLRDCHVPADHVIIEGDPTSTESFALAMTTYNAMRLGIAALCCGVAQRAIDLVVDHLNQREQFGRPLARFQGLRWRVARLDADLEAARLLTYRAARMVDDRGFPPARETALAKLAAAEVAIAAAEEAIQMLGWRGVVRAPEHPAERLYREVRGWSIAGGTTESLLNLLARDVLDGDNR